MYVTAPLCRTSSTTSHVPRKRPWILTPGLGTAGTHRISAESGVITTRRMSGSRDTNLSSGLVEGLLPGDAFVSVVGVAGPQTTTRAARRRDPEVGVVRHEDDVVLGSLRERRSQPRLSDVTVTDGIAHGRAVVLQNEVLAYFQPVHRSGRRERDSAQPMRSVSRGREQARPAEESNSTGRTHPSSATYRSSTGCLVPRKFRACTASPDRRGKAAGSGPRRPSPLGRGPGRSRPSFQVRAVGVERGCRVFYPGDAATPGRGRAY